MTRSHTTLLGGTATGRPDRNKTRQACLVKATRATPAASTTRSRSRSAPRAVASRVEGQSGCRKLRAGVVDGQRIAAASISPAASTSPAASANRVGSRHTAVRLNRPVWERHQPAGAPRPRRQDHAKARGLHPHPRRSPPQAGRTPPPCEPAVGLRGRASFRFRCATRQSWMTRNSTRRFLAWHSSVSSVQSGSDLPLPRCSSWIVTPRP